MSRILTDEQEIIRANAREFATTTLLKKTQEGLAIMAKEGKAPFSFGAWEDMAELGFIGMTVPEEYGGAGLGLVEEMLVIEEISKVNSACSTNIDAHNLALNTIRYCGSEDQRQRYLTRAAKGELILAAAITEPAGSSNFEEWGDTVVEDGDEYVVNATKLWCTNSQAAGLYAVFTKSAQGPGPMDCYLVEGDSPGLEMGGLEEVGKSGTYTGTIFLNDVRVPKANKIPPTDLYTAEWLALGYLNYAAILIGRCESVFNKVLEYTKNRSRRGKPLAELQAVAHRLANMAIQIETARSIAYDAAELVDAGKLDRKLNSIAKVVCSETVKEVTYYAVALHGAAGVDPATGVLSAYQSAAASWSGEYPTDLHRDMIARELGINLDSV